MSAEVDAILAEITATETVLDSAVVYIQSVPGLIHDAVAAATANGATAAELAPLTALATELQGKADAVKAAITANTAA